MKTDKRNISGLLLPGVFAICAWWLMAIRNGYILKWIDEFSLFEPTRIFFRQFLYYPGGLLQYAGTWLTQLMYHPWLGSAILVALWLFLVWLTSKAFRLQLRAMPLVLLLPLALLASILSLDEAWISLNSPGYLFSNTLGFIFTVSATLFYRMAEGNKPASAAVGALSALCYPVAGFYALLAAVVCTIMAMNAAIREKKSRLILIPAITIILIAIIPPLYYSYLNGNTADNDCLYLKGLPELFFNGDDTYLWLPLAIASAVVVILALSGGSPWNKYGKWLDYALAATFCCCLVWNYSVSHKSEQFRATVLMLRHLENNDPAAILRVMSRLKESPNYTMRLLANFAYVSLGGKGEDLSTIAPTSGDRRHAEKFTMTAFINVPLYYNIGRLNQSYRWAMEHTVHYGKRTFFLKYMVLDALLNGDTQLAQRYNAILLSTMFHRQWAKRMQTFIDDPALIGSDPVFSRILQLGEAEKLRENKETTAEIH